MNYQEYFERFGGSFRGKHCKKRSVRLPTDSELPKEFVRLDPWEAEYLWGIAQSASVGILEIGRHNGGSTFLLGCASAAKVTSIDIAPINDVLLRMLLDQHGIGRNIDLIIGNSRTIRSEPGAIDLLFIDGDHTYYGCRTDVVTWYRRVVPGGHIVLHDSYEGSYGVQKAAVEFAKEHPEFDVVQSPVIPANHWTVPTGSIAHLRRRVAC